MSNTTTNTNHILERTTPTATLRVKLAATVVVARRRCKPRPDILHLSELTNADNTENRVSYLFGDATHRTFKHGWEMMLGQSEVQNHLRSTPTKTSLMRYGGEYKFAGGSVDANESLEKAARRELEEEFLCQVPANAKLRLFNIKQTRPVQNTSYIMHNFVCLESENEWLQSLCTSTVNDSLRQRREVFEKLKTSGEYYKMSKFDKEQVCPEVHNVEWLSMKQALTHSFTSMNSEVEYVNEFQQKEFQRLNVAYRDPLFITMAVMTALDEFANIDEIIDFTDQFDASKERAQIQWLVDGQTPEEVKQIMTERNGHHPSVLKDSDVQGSGGGGGGGGGRVTSSAASTSTNSSTSTSTTTSNATTSTAEEKEEPDKKATKRKREEHNAASKM